VWLLTLLLALPSAAVLLPPARPAAPPARPLPPAVNRPIDFVKDVQPILNTLCLSCHGSRKQRGDLRLDSRAAALRTGAVRPGHSADSPLIRRITAIGKSERMPPSGPRLTSKQVGIIRAWIDQGAAWPAVAVASKPAQRHWAYRPLVRPAVPVVKEKAWLRNPIDAFVLARLESAGLTPSPQPDRRTLIRRLSFDLVGLPPSPEEVDAFVADDRPDAYEHLVDRLLASPGHGERWARHWLDVIHFAETHGHDQDVPRENAWPYRDYLIGAFNADLPYRDFVAQQIAGDILYPNDPQGIAATGFLAAGPWDESSQQSIRDDTVDKKQAQNLDRDDMVTTALGAFSGATVHCARCHDHKFDPITQEEYYGLQAVFAGIDRANRPYDPDPAVHRRRLALLRRLADLRTAGAAELLSPANQKAAANWEKERPGNRDAWVVLAPATVTAKNGSVATKLPDGSVRFGGPRPATEVYTITAGTDLAGITAVRLEVLTDDSLPHRGPGRQDNGNLHLNEFRVHAAARGTPGPGKPVAIASASADFDQEGWGVARAIDGNSTTAWGIYPAVGKPHSAVFVFKEPIPHKGGCTLTFTLEQTHGGGHLIGRPRLAVTTTARPAAVVPLPEAVTRILATPTAKRSDAQKAELARFVLTRRGEDDLARLPAPGMVFAAASDFKPEGSFKPARGCRPVQVLKRGDIHQPGARAVPGGLACVPGLPAKFALQKNEDEGERRAALARWLTDPRNVLTWRVIVNRVWQHHFGRGIVATPSDLGRMGAAPTHPELLDWLAVQFRDSGGSLKKLHRRIVTSAAYRQACRPHPGYAKVDSDNLLLWRMNRTRLDAECVRDAVLSASGKLDRRMGGPSVKHFVQTKGIHVTPNVDYEAFDVDVQEGQRRSIYRFVFRTLPDPFMDALDCPDASQFTPVRANSVTPQQALAMLNDRFMIRQAEHLAARLSEAGPDRAAQVRRAVRLTLGRDPTPRELPALTTYAARHGVANACRVLLNCNEFVFVD
jgi:hypothetical protein